MNTPRSMTGYGSGTFTHEGVCYVLELRSVNNRYLKINFKLPSSVSQAQEHLRKLINQHVKRGTVDIFLKNAETNGDSYSLNLAQAEKYMSQLKATFPESDFSPQDVLLLQGVSTRAEAVFSPEFLAALEQGFLDALKAFNVSRISEGTVLLEDICSRLAVCSEYLDKIEELAPLVPEEYRKKLTERIANLLRNCGEVQLDPASLAREVAYFAERADVTEELVRFKHHLCRFNDVVKKGGSLGKECDFIVQELNRETNTIGSKCSNLEIAGHVISIKSEMEKVREQVQNLE